MTSFKAALRSALTEAVGVPVAPTSHHKPRHGSIDRVNAGECVELLSEPVSQCPHCGKAIAPPRTRRRRLWQVVAGGRVLSVEIDP